jgi:hypothetical protein
VIRREDNLRRITPPDGIPTERLVQMVNTTEVKPSVPEFLANLKANA